MAITGASSSPENPAWDHAFRRLEEWGRIVFTAALDGSAYARHGTGLRRLYVARDDDPAGNVARDRLVDRAEAAGIEAIVLSPALGDFNDDPRRLGRDALRASIRVQVAPDDVARFRIVEPA